MKFKFQLLRHNQSIDSRHSQWQVATLGAEKHTKFLSHRPNPIIKGGGGISVAEPVEPKLFWGTRVGAVIIYFGSGYKSPEPKFSNILLYSTVVSL